MLSLRKWLSLPFIFTMYASACMANKILGFNRYVVSDEVFWRSEMIEKYNLCPKCEGTGVCGSSGDACGLCHGNGKGA